VTRRHVAVRAKWQLSYRAPDSPRHYWKTGCYVREAAELNRSLGGYSLRCWPIGALRIIRYSLGRPSIYRWAFAALFRRKYFLNADLIDETGPADIRQVRPLLLVRQVRANALGHDHDERPVVHIQPVRAADELIGAVSDERAIDFWVRSGR
jgi:hypothetical protein